MKSKLLALVVLAGGTMFAGPRVIFGIGFGPALPPPPPRIIYVTPPLVAAPYPYRVWGPRPYVGSYWVAPRYYGRRYFPGYWRRRW